MSYRYTQNWFQQAEQVWPHLLSHLPDRKKFLELGSFEGKSTVWTVENFMDDGAVLYAVDTWEGSEEHEVMDVSFHDAEANFDHNIAEVMAQFPKRKVVKIKDRSFNAMAHIVDDEFEQDNFDFIYIDGSHTAPDVLSDACMAWKLAKNGAVVVFDDYLWGDPRDCLHRPKIAVDAFTNIYGEQLRVLHSGYQFVVQKQVGA